MSDIAITGIGVVSSLGIGRESFWQNVRKSKSGIKRITHFDTSSLGSNIAGWIDNFNPADFMPPRTYRRMSRVSQLAVASSIEALDDSGLTLECVDRERIGVIMGTAYGSSSRVDDFFVSRLTEGPRGAQPFLFPETVPNAPASHIAIFHEITGPNSTFCQNEISAENAMIYAQNLLSQNLVDIVLVGGADELSPMMYSCYDAVRALNGTKVRAGEQVQPRVGGGLVLGEGGAVIVMERLAFAEERDARIYGLLKAGIVAGGMSAINHYDAEGHQMARTVYHALREAGVELDEVGQVDISANYSRDLDRMECRQLQQIFEGTAGDLEVTPLKYLAGDFGGAGITRAAAVLLSIYTREPLPTIRAESLIVQSAKVPQWHRNPSAKTDVTLMTSSTFGGGSSSLIFSKE